jgi:hypothetical protein
VAFTERRKMFDAGLFGSKNADLLRVAGWVLGPLLAGLL